MTCIYWNLSIILTKFIAMSSHNLANGQVTIEIIIFYVINIKLEMCKYYKKANCGKKKFFLIGRQDNKEKN